MEFSLIRASQMLSNLFQLQNQKTKIEQEQKGLPVTKHRKGSNQRRMSSEIENSSHWKRTKGPPATQTHQIKDNRNATETNDRSLDEAYERTSDSPAAPLD